MKETTSNMSILLIDKRNQSANAVGTWLTDGGFLTRRVKNLGQAMELLSDFTVRSRPDVVLLDVPCLARDYENLQSAFQLSSEGEDIVVLALSDDTPPPNRDRFFARNLDQLKTAINKTQATYSYMT